LLRTSEEMVWLKERGVSSEGGKVSMMS